MAILQESEARLKRADEARKRRQMRISQIAGSFALGVLILCAVLIVVAIIVQPNAKVTVDETSSQDAIALRLKALLQEDTAKAAADKIRAQLGKDEFSIITTPTAVSTRASSTIRYDLRIIRGSSFHDEVTLTAADLPQAITMSGDKVVVPKNEETAALQLVVGSGVQLGSYTFTVKGTAPKIERTATATLIVSNLTATNVVVADAHQMAQGAKWQATITWETDAAANGWVEYAEHVDFINRAQQYNFAAADVTNAKSHSLTIYYLEPDSVYHFRIKSVDTANNTVFGTDERFATAKLNP